ncbi:MAG: M42 family metallopeptidase [Chloroflexi bacterium]|nr:M42 family metallopeptidase [Chloroflexota bacterium]MBP8056130.1 M42 family metallopeptidase [Chloroflexota bacterium]
MNDLIKKLVEAFGPSGFEDQVRELIHAEIAPYADEIRVDALGNLIALKKGNGEGKKVLISAHTDEIGVMVTHITKEGFLRFTNIGGVFPVNLMGGRVQFANGLQGVISADRSEDRTKLHPLNKYYIDVGATSREDCPVQVGDAAGFYRPLLVLGKRLVAKSMDDRIGCVVGIEALKRLQNSPHDLYFVFSTQEEVGLRGAAAAANGLHPDVSIALDVTGTGDTPECYPMSVSLGQGAAIKVRDGGMIAHAGLVRLMRQRANDAGIPYQMEVLEGGTTDAYAMQIAGPGSISGCISIPSRYIHSPSEMVDADDVESCIRLLLEILTHPIQL